MVRKPVRYNCHISQSKFCGGELYSPDPLSSPSVEGGLDLRLNVSLYPDPKILQAFMVVLSRCLLFFDKLNFFYKIVESGH